MLDNVKWISFNNWFQFVVVNGRNVRINETLHLQNSHFHQYLSETNVKMCVSYTYLVKTRGWQCEPFLLLSSTFNSHKNSCKHCFCNGNTTLRGKGGKALVDGRRRKKLQEKSEKNREKGREAKWSIFNSKYKVSTLLGISKESATSISD